MCDLDRRLSALDKKIDAVFKADPACQRIARIKGVGPKTATAMVAAVDDGAEFKNGRHLAAWLGLVPRQHSSGDKRVMMGISKRGSRPLIPRFVVIHSTSVKSQDRLIGHNPRGGRARRNVSSAPCTRDCHTTSCHIGRYAILAGQRLNGDRRTEGDSGSDLVDRICQRRSLDGL
jgi:hypothetical protein